MAAECVTVKYYTHLTIIAKKNFFMYSANQVKVFFVEEVE
jgi:hypothetical protein